MGRTVCTEPQCLYKGALYLLQFLPKHTRNVLGQQVLVQTVNMSSRKTNDYYIRIQQLHDTHCEAILNSGNWCLLGVHEEDVGLSIALFRGDNRFHLNG